MAVHSVYTRDMTNPTYTLIIEITDDAFSAFIRKDIAGGVSGPFSNIETFDTLADIDAWVARLGFTQDKAMTRHNAGTHTTPLALI